MSTPAGETDVVRYFTRARRIPIVFGKFPEGTKVPGGPYTGMQLLVGGLAAAALYVTYDWWKFGGFIVDGITAVALVWGVTYLAGKIPTTGRNPLLAALSAVNVATAPIRGKVNGRPIRFVKPHRMISDLSIVLPAGEISSREEIATVDLPLEQAGVPDPAQIGQVELPAAPVVPSLARTGLERLLEQTRGA